MQKISLDARTIQALKNFATINPSILITPGKELRTISPLKNIFGKAKLNQEFETEFAIYDLSRFISVLSLFESPELNIDDKFMTISSGDKSLKYAFADASNITVPPSKDIVLPSIDVEVEITNTVLNDVIRALAVLRLPEIAITGDGKNIYIKALDSSGKTNDCYDIQLPGSTKNIFTMIFKAENIKILPGDYTVRLSAQGIAHFSNDDAEYFIALEDKSKFEKLA